MSSLSLHLPDELAKESAVVAKELGISRTQFIRQALAHELAKYRLYKRQNEMGKALQAMESSIEYQVEVDEIEQLSDGLSEEEDSWWEKDK